MTSESKSFACDSCGKIFNTKSHLKQHLNKKYKCYQNDETADNPTMISYYMKKLKEAEDELTEERIRSKRLIADHAYLIREITRAQHIIDTALECVQKKDKRDKDRLSIFAPFQQNFLKKQTIEDHSACSSPTRMDVSEISEITIKSGSMHVPSQAPSFEHQQYGMGNQIKNVLIDPDNSRIKCVFTEADM